ncbi:YdbH domain-containing protein [Sphingomonas sp. MMS24-J13]|uniref:intermembrane phospholipid transport protein YdbH family protein n=1 Tax=Sphingomonas sp. MMS24-J13 TaxID=3238686 RepID=UPI00384C2DF9
MTASADEPPRWRRHRRTVGRATAIFLLLLLLALWLGRQRIATHLVNEHLAKAGVPAAYRITKLTPFSQRIEDLRLGDPAHPDLVARRVDLGWRYGLNGPVLASVEADGIRLVGRIRNGRLSLGTIDRLLPQSSSGGPSLPDLNATLSDTHIALATPAGAIGAWLTGAGNLARNYRGQAIIDAPSLASGGCAIDHAAAKLAIRIVDRSPHLLGPVTIGGAHCLPQALTIGAGTLTTDVALTPELDGADGRVTLAGFAGRAGSIRFGAAAGTISLAGKAKDAHGRANLTLAGLQTSLAHADSFSIAGGWRLTAAERHFDGAIGMRRLVARRDIVDSIGSGARAVAGTPIGPIAARIGASIARILTRADAEAQLAYMGSGARQSVRIDQATLTAGRDQVSFTGSGSREARGWTFDGRAAGSALPALAVRGDLSGGSVTALVRIEPYSVGSARLALAPVEITAGKGTTRFATTATISGPIGSGSVEGLTLPIAATYARSGELRVGEGCIPIGFARVRVAALTLDPGTVRVCGQPLLVRRADGSIAIAAIARDVTLDGRTGTAPLTLHAARLGLSGTSRFTAEQLDIALGAADDDPTRLAVAKLDGQIGANGPSGTFADAAGSIRHVPLALSGATGTWRLEQGALRLEGALGVADRGPNVRFNPLTSGDVKLALVDGRIDASASLRSPRYDKPVANITLTHDLATGSGGARIDVPALTFARNRFQPEMLTPLTLGVIANTVGTISGRGRIDWTADAITSSGDFHTDRTDLAAAFGPVSGIEGDIHFTDLLGMVTAPHQAVRIAEINPGVSVANGVAHYQMLGPEQVKVEDAVWPFAGGTLSLDPTTLDFSETGQRRLTFQVAQLDAGIFIQQLDFPNISATGTFDGKLPMIFDATGGRIEGGLLQSRGGGQLAYIGELSNAELGTMGKMAFDALKAIHYSTLGISLDGKLDGEIVSRVRFQGVRDATPSASIAARLIRNLPFRFNIEIRAPFRGLVGSAQAYMNPETLLRDAIKPAEAQGNGQPPAIQPADSGPVR